ncbi:unnamed protein product [Cuscuta europaea]|uniref:Uncharacterized protein n=1 Tax=Cuscuta europaea TaxID=41803 RepID=A0A9P0ZCL6_CUSEU|nr:unnamed protein product [Cuscuta europaea]
MRLSSGKGGLEAVVQGSRRAARVGVVDCGQRRRCGQQFSWAIRESSRPVSQRRRRKSRFDTIDGGKQGTTDKASDRLMASLRLADFTKKKAITFIFDWSFWHQRTNGCHEVAAG